MIDKVYNILYSDIIKKLNIMLYTGMFIESLPEIRAKAFNEMVVIAHMTIRILQIFLQGSNFAWSGSGGLYQPRSIKTLKSRKLSIKLVKW